jgi:catechol 2,3-dioxygenase-like lactoylglutathione lyase family enzyme
MTPAVRSLHHMAFRCRDSEATRAFYEDVVGLEFAAALELTETKTGRPVEALHTFFRMRDGACVAFFETPGVPFAFAPRHDFDLHIALEVSAEELEAASERAKARGLELRGPVDHSFIRSIYLRDPDGYVVELCERREQAAETWSRAAALAALERWKGRRMRTRERLSAEA